MNNNPENLESSNMENFDFENESGEQDFDTEGVSMPLPHERRGYHHPPPPHHHERPGHHPPPPPPHHHHNELIPGLNSLAMETLLELASHINNLDDIASIIKEIDIDLLPLFSRVKEMEISDVPTFLKMLVLEEANDRLEIRRSLIADIINRKAAVFLPLPPYLTDLLKANLIPELVFHTEGRLQAHIQLLKFRELNFDTFAQAAEDLKSIQTLALDGQTEPGRLIVRSNAASLISIMLEKELRKVIIHKIPHLPRGEHFVTVAISEFDIQVLSV